jgi:phosphatidylglycerol---prolipoprotein diacylglyceryl transferase
MRVLWLGMNRPQWFLLAVLPLLLQRVLRVFGKPLLPKLEKTAA